MSAPQEAPAPVEGVDVVRMYDHSRDEHALKMLVGQGIMEGLARANNKIITSPFVLLPIIIIGLVISHYAGFAINSNPLSYIYPLVGPALALLPLLASIEYLQRPAFTARLRKTIGSLDMIKPSVYYAPAQSGVWVFEHEGSVVGAVCLDAGEQALEKLNSVLGEEDGQVTGEKGVVGELVPKKAESNAGLRKRPTVSATKNETRPVIARIRHLDVDQPYRKSGVGSELLLIALDHAFDVSVQSPCRIEKVYVYTNPMSVDGDKLLIKCGFVPVTKGEAGADWEDSEKIGLFGWKGRWMSVSRDRWLEKRTEILAKNR
ncbi:hypothetical protein B9479_001496 [Cryptococcus floricola]|uniref:N-acetyltransferase domain-containing protein n=1 Tax=Cryptococcus floricola TaxID=2591691 RepID=A0A5D3B6G2_9TREE|nr:hypothetical protein B9479_001496 [Cryptococcus floricola]